MPSEDRFTAETSFRVRYAETDAMGIVHHANYIVYFELGRSHYARSRGHSYAEMERNGMILVVSALHARYLKPAVYDDLITIRTWIADIKSRRVSFSYEIINERGEILVTGTSEHICVDTSGKVTLIPEQWRAWGSS